MLNKRLNLSTLRLMILQAGALCIGASFRYGWLVLLGISLQIYANVFMDDSEKPNTKENK